MLNRTRIVDRLIAWAPIMLLGALAALTWWLDAQINEGNAGRNGNDRHDPDVIIEGVRAVELDAEGNAVQTLAARHAAHYPDDGTVEFEAPNFITNQPGRPSFTVQAERGRVSGDRENAYFEGNVRATRGPEEDEGEDGIGIRGPITLSTEFLHVIPKQDRAETDRAVTIEEPRGIIRAVGLTLDNESRTMKLNAEVRGSFLPPEASPETTR